MTPTSEILLQVISAISLYCGNVGKEQQALEGHLDAASVCTQKVLTCAAKDYDKVGLTENASQCIMSHLNKKLK
jgi:hypothetical protein